MIITRDDDEDDEDDEDDDDSEDDEDDEGCCDLEHCAIDGRLSSSCYAY